MIGLGGMLAILLLLGCAAGLAQRGAVRWRWLLVALALVALNDALLTRGYGLIPNLFPDAEWNWQGKAMALAASCAVAALPWFGWRASGLTLRQERAGIAATLAVALGYCLFFLAIAIAFPDGPASPETVAFQLTMPGIEEEIFYRGILLLALDRAFTARWRFLGVDWGWGALLSCIAFGLAHAFGYGSQGFAFDPLVMALTAVPSLLAVWLRLRTGSVAVPILLHNFGNAIGLIV